MSDVNGSAQTGGGWCTHGVPYSPNWNCSLCLTATAPQYRTTQYTPPPIDQRRLFRALDRIVVLLEEVAGRRR